MNRAYCATILDKITIWQNLFCFLILFCLLSYVQMFTLYYIRVNTNLKLSGFVTGFLKRKSSLFVIRSLENQILYFVVLHCYNQPLTKPDSSGWWRPCITHPFLPLYQC